MDCRLKIFGLQIFVPGPGPEINRQSEIFNLKSIYPGNAHDRPVLGRLGPPNPVKMPLRAYPNRKTPVKYVFFHSPDGIR